MKPATQTALLTTLQRRFEQHPERHQGQPWPAVLARLQAAALAQLDSLQQMEASGGEPDVIGPPDADAALLFCDCAAESPGGRRSLCYDREALQSRKEHKPADSAIELARAMGIRLMSEAEYRELQRYGDFDTKSSSWVLTPPAIRSLGGALFCDRRYGQVFTYHNGAQSYYAARGFRGVLRV